MRIYEPAEVTVDGTTPVGWHMTCRTDTAGPWPVGYCAVPGDHVHDLPAGAYDCWRRYLADHALLDGYDPDVRRPCGVCDVWTNHLAVVAGIATLPLCPDHLARDHVLAALQGDPERTVMAT